jgi:glutamyl-tRNA synthetase
MKTNEENSLEALEVTQPALETLESWTAESIHDALIGLAERLELKNGRIMWPVRVAVSGKMTTPGGAVEICHILGKEETLRRMKIGMEQLAVVKEA